MTVDDLAERCLEIVQGLMVRLGVLPMDSHETREDAVSTFEGLSDCVERRGSSIGQ